MVENTEDLKDFIKGVLFEIGKDIKIHKIDKDNIILEIDYDKYADVIVDKIINQDS